MKIRHSYDRHTSHPPCPPPIRPVSWKFLDFPSDIRNLIYHHLLISNSLHFEDLTESWLGWTRRRNGLSPEIMRTCRQIHDETVYILYSKNYFVFDIDYNDYEDNLVVYNMRYDAFKHSALIRHAPLMRNWRILFEDPWPWSRIVWKLYEKTVLQLRMICMVFQSLKINVNNLFVDIKTKLEWINFPQLDPFAPLKELRVRGKASIEVAFEHLAAAEVAFEYFQSVVAIIKSLPNGEGPKGNLQDNRVVQSQSSIQDLETVTKKFQRVINDEKYAAELQKILGRLGHHRAKAILQDPKRLVRKELCQYLGMLEDIFNSILYERMRTRPNFDYNEFDEDIIAMNKARRWLYMRPEYLAWIQGHDRNAPYSRGPIYYEEGSWNYDSWHNKKRNDFSISLMCSKPKRTEVDPNESSPSFSDMIRPSRPAKIHRPRNPKEQYTLTLDDLYSANDMPSGLGDQAPTCTLKFQISRRQHRGAISPKIPRRKKPQRRERISGGGEKLGDCLELYEECF